MFFSGGPSPWPNDFRKGDGARYCIEHLFKKRVAGILECLGRSQSLDGGVSVRGEQAKIRIRSFVEADYQRATRFSRPIEVFIDVGVVENGGGAIKIHGTIEAFPLVQ